LYSYREIRSSHMTGRVIWIACDCVYHFSHGRAVPRHSSPLFAASTPTPSNKSSPLAPPVANHCRAHRCPHLTSPKPSMTNPPKIPNSNLDLKVPPPLMILIYQTTPPPALIHRLVSSACASTCTTTAPLPPLFFATISSSSLSTLHRVFCESELTSAKSSTNPSGKGAIQFITDPIDHGRVFSLLSWSTQLCMLKRIGRIVVVVVRPFTKLKYFLLYSYLLVGVFSK
jgi:hypothetical protein